MSEGARQDRPDRDDQALLAEYMDRHELAKALGVSLDTLSRWSTQRIGPPSVRLGRKVLYRREAVRHWLVEREAGAGPLRGVGT